MKIYLDTNVFLDMIVPRDNRQDNVNALRVIKLAGTGKFQFCISPLSVSTAYYVLRKDCELAKRIQDKLQFLSVIPMAENDVRFSVFFDYPDREDAMQMSCAQNADCEMILTRNPKHYANSSVPCLSPEEFLSRLG